MNCEQAQQAFLASLAGERPTRDDGQVSRHVTECAACREATAEVATLWSSLAVLPDPAPPAGMRARFDAALAGLEREPIAPRRANPRWKKRLGRLLAGLAGVRPVPAVAALGVAALAFALGHFMALRGGQMAALQRDLQSTRSLVALSLLQQQSAVDRLRGASFSARVGVPDAELVGVLLQTIETDPSVDVRLAAVDALANRGDSEPVRAGLRRALAQQSSPLVQIAIIDALVFQRETAAQPVLRSIAADSLVHDAVRERARRADHQLTM